MNSKLTCPKCSGEGDKILTDFINWFSCDACGFRCRMKHYRSYFEPRELKTLIKNPKEEMLKGIISTSNTAFLVKLLG